MNEKPPSALIPGPDCAQLAPLLPLLNSGALEPDETRAICDHMARCAWCQQQAHEYEMMEAAMRERFSVAPAARPLISMDDILARAGTPRSLAPQGSHAHLQPPVRLFSQQEPAPASSAPRPFSPAREKQREESQGEMPMFRRIKLVAAVATIAAIVALFAVILHGFTPNHGSNTAAQPGATTGYGPRLTNAQAMPIFAPSNPNMVYELLPPNASSTQIALWRSADGGKTWKQLAVPGGKTTDSIHPSLFVSPLDSEMIFLTIDSGKLANGLRCPASQASAGTVGAFIAHSGGHFDCATQYYSADGGAHWSLLQLPQDPNLGTGAIGYLSNSGAGATFARSAILAQGTRLYTTQGQSSDNGVVFGAVAARLVTSTDGGKTWQYADNALAAQGLILQDYATTPGGSTVFAVTNGAGSIMNTDSLWRSDDAGATWTQVGPLPGTEAMPGIDESSLVAVDGGAQPALYVNIDDSYVVGDHVITVPHAPTNLHVSLDGGKTWQQVTQQGLPVNDTCLATLGTLSDGSALTACPSGDVYAWKSGDAGWHKVGSLPAGDSGKIRVAQMIAGSNHQPTLLLVLGQPGDYRVERVSIQ